MARPHRSMAGRPLPPTGAVTCTGNMSQSGTATRGRRLRGFDQIAPAGGVASPAEAAGERVTLRLLTRHDRDLVEGVLAGLSPTSLEQRFLVPVARLPESVMRALTDVDGERHVAWAALRDGRPVGLGRYVRVGAHSAELAVEVVDQAQRRGIGSLLMARVVRSALAAGLTHFTAVVLPSNTAMVAALRHRGVRMAPTRGLLEVEAPLQLLVR